MKAFLNVTIRTKFYLFLVTTVAAFVIIFLFFVYSLYVLQEYRDYNQDVDNIMINYLEMKQSEQQFILRNNEDAVFFKTNENKFLRRFELAHQNINILIEQAKTNKITKELDLTEDFNKINDDLAAYYSIFTEHSKLIFQRGYSETGIIGEMKRSAKNAQVLVKNEQIQNFLDKLRESEKSYLVDKDIVNYNNFLKTFTNLNSYVNNNKKNLQKVFGIDSTLTDSTQFIDANSSGYAPAFIKNMNDYKRYFLALVKIDKGIGINSEEGLNGEIKNLVQQIDPEIDRLYKTISATKASTVSGIMQNLYFFVGFVLFALILIILQLSRSISDPLHKLKSYLQPLSKGILPDKLMEMQGLDEFSRMTNSVNELIEGLKQTTSFATTIGNGVFNTDFKPLSEQDDLGNSLLEMRKNLLQAQKEEEKRKYEDSLRKWANEGLAKFSEIMRQSTNNIESLASNVIKNLVGFLEANQGGLFLINDLKKDDIHLELVAAYAYNQERRKKKKIYLGEGLVGMCAIEKASVYMTEVPNDYLTITSGLGGSNPKSLLIVPLKVEDLIFGVVEIASFKTFEKHEVEFVEKVSESIASTLSIAKINARTAELLEQSQQQAEEMAAQEEEMRQNLEELQATQEESARREAEMISILNAINSSSLVVEFDLNGIILEVNNATCNLFNLSREQMIGRHQGDFEDMERDKIKSVEFWERLRRGETIKETHHLHLPQREVWLHEVYSPIVDSEGRPYKILNLATDISESKKQERALIQQAEIMAAQEEALRQNIEELTSTQEEMARKQSELESMNEKLFENERSLQEALKRAHDQERKINQKNAELTASEEELRQNMEELQATQEEIERQHDELEKAKAKLEGNEAVLRKAVEKSKEQEQFFKFIIENSAEAILQINTNGIIIQSNKTAEQFTGYNKVELEKSDVAKVFKQIDVNALQNGQTKQTAVFKKDQTTIVVQLTVLELVNKDLKSFVLYFNDISTHLQQINEISSHYEIELKKRYSTQKDITKLHEQINILQKEIKELKKNTD